MSTPNRNKSSHLWNVQEPGDPYDIKKSMIAKLPDHPPQPMGEHLDLICLLQAAQIERLSDYLSQLQCRYREVEKKELDRHSYEVQIKQLAQKNISFSNLKGENDRLKDFIRRQSIQLQELQKLNLQIRNIEALNAKYEGVLNELRLSREHNQRSEQQISRLNIQIAEWKSKCERLELDKVTLKSQFDLQINQKIAIQIKQALAQAQQRNNRLQIELRQGRQNLDNKNHEIQILTTQQEQILRQMRVLQEKSRTQGNIESTIGLKQRQIQKLKGIIDEQSSKYEQSQMTINRIGGQIKILEEKYFSLEKQRNNLIASIRELQQSKKQNQTFDKYEERVAMMSMEIQRLNNINITRTREYNEKCNEIQKIRGELNLLRDQLKRNQSDLNLMAAHQQKIGILSQQLQRITLQLRAKNDEIHNLHQKITITQSNSSQISIINTQKSRLQQQLQASRTQHRNYKTITDSQINNLKSECNKIRHQLDFQVGLKGEAQKYKIQCERLRGDLEKLRNQNISFRKSVQEEKNSNLKIITERNQLLEERNRVISERNHLLQENKRIGSQILQVRRDMQEFKSLARDLNGKDNVIRSLQLQIKTKNSHYQNIEKTLQNVYKQIQRLHSVLALKASELMQVSKEYSQLQQQYRTLQSKNASSSTEKYQFEHQLKTMQQEIQTIQRYKSQLAYQLQNKNKQIRISADRHQVALNEKDSILRQYKKQKQVLQRKLIQLQRELAQRVPHQEQIAQDYQKALQQIRNKDTIVKRMQATIHQIEIKYQQQELKVKEWQRKVFQWEGRLKDVERVLKSKDDEINRLNLQKIKLSQEVATLSQDISKLNTEVLNSRIKKEDELRLKEKIDNLNQQNLKLRMKLDEIERSRDTSVQSINLQLQRAEETIIIERGQNQSLRQQLKRLEQRLSIQNRELQDVDQKIKEYQLKIVHIQSTNSKVLQDKLAQYEIKLQQRDNLVIKLQQEIKQVESQFGQYVDKDRTALGSLTQYQNKIALLSAQFQRLNSIVQEKNQEARGKDATISQFRQDIAKLGTQLQEKDRLIDSLRVKLSQPAQGDSEQYKRQIAFLKDELQKVESIKEHALAQRDQLFQISHQIKAQYDANLAKMALEEKNIKSELQYRLQENRALGEELGQLRKKQQSYLLQLRQAQGKVRQEDPNLRRRVAQLEQIIANGRKQINELTIHNTNLKTQVNQLENMLQQNQRSSQNREYTNSLTLKINQYSQMLNAKEQDVAYWQNKYTALYSAYEELYTNYNLTKTEYETTISNIKIYQTKMFRLQQDFSSLSDALRNAKVQLQSYQQQNYALKNKMKGDSDLYQKNLLLSKQIDRLTDFSSKMKQDLSDTRIRLTDHVSLNKRIQEHLGLFVLLFAQIESLRSRLAHSQQECQEVRRNSLVPLRVDRSPGSRH